MRSISFSKVGAVTMCAASAALGGVLTMSAASVASPAHQDWPNVAAKGHYLHGGYILADKNNCPKGTTIVNASVRGNTNSRSGHTTFSLCYVK